MNINGSDEAPIHLGDPSAKTRFRIKDDKATSNILVIIALKKGRVLTSGFDDYFGVPVRLCQILESLGHPIKSAPTGYQCCGFDFSFSHIV